MTNIYYNEDYVSCGEKFDTTRKSGNIVKSLESNPIKGIVISDPSEFYDTTDSRIQEVTDPEYLNALLTGTPRGLAESSSFEWDENTYKMARSHSAGIVAAVTEVMANGGISGSLSSGLHHARRDGGAGFCTINGLAVGIAEAMRLGAEKVLVLDFDAHGGGGTFSFIRRYWPASVTQVDVSTSAFDIWEEEGDSRVTFVPHEKHESYDKYIKRALDYARTLGKFDIIIYNAGMDPINDGVDIDLIEKREQMVREFVGETPALFTLAGGYSWGATEDDVVDWHRITLQSWAK